MTDVEFSLEQRNAIDLCCDTHTTIASVTGGAGVGKTLVMGEVYNELVDMKKSVALCAPTGRAAKRIEELTGIKALTVHRLLSFPMPYENQDKKLDPHLPRMNRAGEHRRCWQAPPRIGFGRWRFHLLLHDGHRRRDVRPARPEPSWPFRHFRSYGHQAFP